MTLTLQLKQKRSKHHNFDDTLSVTINGETKELNEIDKIATFVVADDREATVEVFYRRNDIQSIQNPVGRFFARLFLLLLSPFIFFMDNDNGIGIHRFFHSAKPFDLAMTCKLMPTAAPVSVTFVPPLYVKNNGYKSKPEIQLQGAEIGAMETICTYNPAAMKRDFRMYHYPAYTVIFVLTAALHALMAAGLIRQFTSAQWTGVLAISLCWLVILAITTALIRAFLATRRLFEKIDRDLRKTP